MKPGDRHVTEHVTELTQSSTERATLLRGRVHRNLRVTTTALHHSVQPTTRPPPDERALADLRAAFPDATIDGEDGTT